MPKQNLHLDSILPFEYLESKFVYDYVNGEVYSVETGKSIGYLTKSGYRIYNSTIKGKRYCIMVPRLAWTLATGRWPYGNIFCIDGDNYNLKPNNIANRTSRYNHLIRKLENDLKQDSIKPSKIKEGSCSYQVSFGQKRKQSKDFFYLIEWKRDQIKKRLNELESDYITLEQTAF